MFFVNSFLTASLKAVECEEVKKAENNVANGGKAKAEAKEGENVEMKNVKTASVGRTYVISAEEMEEFKMMKAVLATRQGKALFLDYLEGDIGRYVILVGLIHTLHTLCLKVCGHD